LKSQKNKRIEKTRYIPVGRIDGSINGSIEGRIDATVILSCKFNRGKKMKQSERRKKQVKTHLTLCSELKRRSRIQVSSAHLLFFATESEMGLTIS